MVKFKKRKRFVWNDWYVYDKETKKFVWVGDLRKLKKGMKK